MIKNASVAFVFFLLGTGLGFLLAARPNDRDRPEGPAGAGERAPVPAAVAPPATAADEPAAPTAGRTELSKAIAAIAAEELSTATGTITGRVVTEEDAAVANVLVRAEGSGESPAMRKSRRGHTGDWTIEDEVVDVISRRRFQDVTRCETRTGQDGRFALTVLREYTYSVSAFADDYEIFAEGGTRNVEAGQKVAFTAHPVVALTCTVLLPGGAQPDEATIDVQTTVGEGGRGRSISSRSEQWLPDSPVLRLRSGSVSLSARVTIDGEEYASDKQEVVIAAGVAPPPMTFNLRGRTGIKGVVELQENEVVASLLVYVASGGVDSAFDPRRMPRGNKRDWLNRSRGFEFSFPDLAPGTYGLYVAFSDEGPVVAADAVEVVDRMVVHNVKVPPLDPSEYVVVWVYGPDGTLLRDVSIASGRRSGSSSSSGGSPVLKRKDGAFLVLHYRRSESSGDEDGDDVRYSVCVRSSVYGAKNVEYRRGKNSELTVRFVEPATLDVTVTGYAGSNLEGWLFVDVLEKSDDSSVARMRAIRDPRAGGLDAEGRQTFGPLEPGSYDVSLRVKSDDAFSDSRRVASVPVTLQAGKNAVQVAVPELHTLTVVFDDPPASGRVNLLAVGERRSAGLLRLPRRIDKDGKVEFTFLTAGEYRVTVQGGGADGMGEMRVSVPADREVRFAPKPLNALAITVTDAAGRFAEAGFQTGDLLIGLQGAEFTNAIDRETAERKAMGDEEVECIVLRGNERITLKVIFQKLRERGIKGPGGYMEPTSR